MSPAKIKPTTPKSANGPGKKPPADTELPTALGRCLCGEVEIRVTLPAFWAWHDHSKSTQRAHGAAYATYIGCWKSKVRIAKGKDAIASVELEEGRRFRSFCSRCGTPLLFERRAGSKMINLPRALFDGRTGREPRYHIGHEQSPEWAFRGEALKPVKNYPGLLQSRPSKKKTNEWSV